MFFISGKINNKKTAFFHLDPLCVACDDIIDDRGYNASSLKRQETIDRQKSGFSDIDFSNMLDHLIHMACSTRIKRNSPFASQSLAPSHLPGD